MLHLLRQLQRFHELVTAFVGRELRGRYRGSLLGPGWMLLQPLLYLVVYFVVFAKMFDVQGLAAPAAGDTLAREAVLHSGRSYGAMVMLCGLVPWLSLSEALVRAGGSLLETSNLIKKFAFPSELIPLHLVAVSLINTAVSLVVLVVAVYLSTGLYPTALWLLPLALLLQGILTLGIAYILASITVFLRDLLQMVPMFVTFAFFLSPIFYARVPDDRFAWVLTVNPVTWLIDLYRTIFVRTRPALADQMSFEMEVSLLAVVSVVLLTAGLQLFLRLKPRFADEV